MGEHKTWVWGVSEKLTKVLIVTNPLGLHARSAAKIGRTLAPFTSRVEFLKDGRSADARSILSILTLDCPEGSQLTVDLEGDDAAAALQALTDLFDARFKEQP